MQTRAIMQNEKCDTICHQYLTYILVTIQTQKDIEHHTKLLIKAVKNGDFETVKLLLPVSDPKTNNSLALQYAVQNGYTDIVELLIPVSNLQTENSYPLQYAVYNGHLDIVKLLIPVSDPKAYDSRALRMAVQKGYNEIIQLLLPVSDYFIAEQYMKQEGLDTTLLLKHIDQYEALQQQERLTHQLNSNFDHTQHSSVKRKI